MVYLNCLSDLRSGFTVIPIGRLQVALSFLFFFIIFTLSTVDIHNSRPLDAFRIFLYMYRRMIWQCMLLNQLVIIFTVTTTAILSAFRKQMQVNLRPPPLPKSRSIRLLLRPYTTAHVCIHMHTSTHTIGPHCPHFCSNVRFALFRISSRCIDHRPSASNPSKLL